MTHPIGKPGQPWGDAEKAVWRSQQTKKRSYEAEVLTVIERLRDRLEVVQYGRLDYDGEGFPLFALKSRQWNDALPCVLVTGGVHGYETSGVHGALQFAEQHGNSFAGRLNVLVAPCVSPWAYERIHRWNRNAIDPNRSFREGSQAVEASALMQLVAPMKERFLVHIDLHETTDSDESEFRPALAARDGKVYEPGEIPDGFYVVGDTENPQPEFQKAIIAAVAKVTHIAPPDANGQIIGCPVASPGVINYAVKSLGLCASVTDARFVTTTEVYPDSPRASPKQCNDAQVAAVLAGLEFALRQ
jgi:hypothetical protein